MQVLSKVCYGDFKLPAMQGPPQLQYCYMVVTAPHMYGPWPLPAGSWLAGLRWLAASLGSLLAAGAGLRAAAALEVVEVLCSEFDDAHWVRIKHGPLFDWLAGHPTLRRVVFRGCDSNLDDPSDFQAAVAKLRSQRPDLHVHCCDLDEGGDGQTFLEVLDRVALSYFLAR